MTTIRLSPVSLARLKGPVPVRPGDPSWPPPGWTVERREPCAGDHAAAEECDICRAVCVGPLETV
jgi:hypothetical protein